VDTHIARFETKNESRPLGKGRRHANFCSAFPSVVWIFVSSWDE
jgi:hypothetical protein